MQFSINSILPKIPFYFSHLLLDSPMKPLDLLESEYFKENCIKTPKPILCRPSLSFTILQIWLLTFLIINYHLLLNIIQKYLENFIGWQHLQVLKYENFSLLISISISWMNSPGDTTAKNEFLPSYLTWMF